MNAWNGLKEAATTGRIPYPGLLVGLMVLLWSPLQRMFQSQGLSTGFLDPTIWLLILLSFAVFLVLLSLAWYLAKHYWVAFGFPEMEMMVLQFSTLDAWQQLKFYYGFFALLLLAGLGCLAAVL